MLSKCQSIFATSWYGAVILYGVIACGYFAANYEFSKFSIVTTASLCCTVSFIGVFTILNTTTSSRNQACVMSIICIQCMLVILIALIVAKFGMTVFTAIVEARQRPENTALLYGWVQIDMWTNVVFTILGERCYPDLENQEEENLDATQPLLQAVDISFAEWYISTTVPYDKDVSCVICMVDEDAEDKICLSCGHQFHNACISTWSSVKRSCPICRHVIELNI